MTVTTLQNNFTSGEISPMMEGAIGTQRYQTGLSTCENFLPLRQGGIRRRPGTHYVGEPKNVGKPRLIDFQAPDGSYYIAEFTQVTTSKIIRFWKADFTLLMDGLNPLELTSPYSETDFPLIKYATVKGIIYLVHPSYAPRTLTFNAGTGLFTIATPTFTGDRTFASTNNYPSIITFKGGRLYLGGTNAEPNAIFASMTPVAATGADRFTTFTFGADADDAIYLQESDMYGTHLHWLVTQKRVVAGTDRSIWMDSGAAATPSTFDMSIVSFTGSSNVQAKISENIIVYSGRSEHSLHAMIFSEESGGYVDIDLTRDADHILAGGIDDFSVMSFPEPIVWVVRSDGVLCSCTIDQKNGIVAWARHPMGEGAVVESLTTGVCTAADDVWLCVKRGAKRTIECLRFCDLYTGAIEDAFFVDCAIQVVNSPADETVSTLYHLIGYEVDALGDGAVLPRKTVPAGAEITYDREVAKCVIGIPYTSTMATMRPELPSNGTSQGKLRRLEKIIIRFYMSLGGKVGGSLTELSEILDSTWGLSVYGSAKPPVSGDKTLDLAGGNTTDGRVYLVQDSPVPFNVLAVMTRYSVMEV